MRHKEGREVREAGMRQVRGEAGSSSNLTPAISCLPPLFVCVYSAKTMFDKH